MLVATLLLLWSVGAAQATFDYFEEIDYHVPVEQTTVEFTAFRRTFQLQLEPDESVFASDFELEINTEKQNKKKTDYLVKGSIKGDPDSHVIGSLFGGTFEGRLELGNGDQFFVEDSNKFRDQFSTSKKSLIYHEKNVTDRFRRSAGAAGVAPDAGAAGPCGLNNPEIRRRMEDDLKNGAETEKDVVLTRVSRAAADQKKICDVFMQADITLWKVYLKDNNNDVQIATAQLMKFFGEHIQEVNRMYNKEEFSSRDGSKGPFKNVGFRIRRSRIYTDCNAAGVPKDLCKTNIDIANFLTLNSKIDQNLYCVAYMWTYREFSDGALGLAYIPTDTYMKAGVCAKRGRLNYNTGIVTLLNSGRRVARYTSPLTFAHELGHNFGSQHDPEDVNECIDGGSKGNYLMYPYVSAGTKPNNKLFSVCSKADIANIIDAMLTGRKDNCLKTTDEPFCGNAVYESDKEQCDCGYEDQCNDQCCWPMASSGTDSKSCTIKKGSCSPSQGPCCSTSCSYITNSVCAKETECAEAATCGGGGSSAACPAASPKPDTTLCAANTRRCKNGECWESVCGSLKDAQGQPYEECQIPVPKGAPVSTEYCFVSCKAPGSGVCHNTMRLDEAEFDVSFKTLLYDAKIFGSAAGQALKLPPGAPCDNNKGFCDVFNKCRPVNAQGPLLRLANLLFKNEEINSPSDWFVKYWYVVALVALVFIFVSFVVIWKISDRCPTSNPKFPQSKKWNTKKQAQQGVASM